MTYNYIQTGGFGGLAYEADGNSQNLPENLRKVLEPLFENQPNIGKPNPLARDALKYQLQLTSNGKTITLNFDDTNIPKTLEPLIDYLRQHAALKK